MSPFDPLRILRALHDARAEFVVIGQSAAVLHGFPHTTIDVDITPRAAIDNAARLAEALNALHATHAVGEPARDLPIDERDFLGWSRTLRFDTDAGPVDVVPIPAGTSGYEDLILTASVSSVQDMSIPIASIPDLIRTKRAAGRPKDLRQLPALEEFQRWLNSRR